MVWGFRFSWRCLVVGCGLALRGGVHLALDLVEVGVEALQRGGERGERRLQLGARLRGLARLALDVRLQGGALLLHARSVAAVAGGVEGVERSLGANDVHLLLGVRLLGGELLRLGCGDLSLDRGDASGPLGDGGFVLRDRALLRREAVRGGIYGGLVRHGGRGLAHDGGL